MEPAAFAAELISRLEKLKLELESRHSLEERLQQIREVRTSFGSSLPCACARTHLQVHTRVPTQGRMNPGSRGAAFLFTSPSGSSVSRMKKRRGLSRP